MQSEENYFRCVICLLMNISEAILKFWVFTVLKTTRSLNYPLNIKQGQNIRKPLFFLFLELVSYKQHLLLEADLVTLLFSGYGKVWFKFL